VQALDPGLRAATGADAGVVVAYVNPNGPAAQHLAAADVVTAIGSAPVRSKTDYAAALMQLAPGTAVTVALVRHGAPMTVSMTPVARGSIPEQGGGDLGLDLRDVKGAGAEAVRVAPRSAAALAGIEPGDLIVGIGDADVPDARTIARVFQQAAAGSHILVRIERGPEHLVLALAKP